MKDYIIVLVLMVIIGLPLGSMVIIEYQKAQCRMEGVKMNYTPTAINAVCK